MYWQLMYISLNFILLMIALVYLLIGSMASYLIQKDFVPVPSIIWPFLDYPFVIIGVLLFIPPGMVFVYRYFIAFRRSVIIYLILISILIIAIFSFFSISISSTNLIIINDSMAELKETFRLYIEGDKQATTTFNHVHKWYSCCGFNGREDFNTTNPAPSSCKGNVGCKDRITNNIFKDLILMQCFNFFTGLYLIGVTIYFILYRKHEKESGVYMERRTRRNAARARDSL